MHNRYWHSIDQCRLHCFLKRNTGVNRRGCTQNLCVSQGLNIAPALISVSPIKTVVNPTGPLAITDTLVSVTVPALP